MDKFYTSEKNFQILIALLKAHNIRKIVASPGTTNLTFVGSVQNDKYFEVYSSIDERSAGYIACGMAAESGEPVVLSCTGATASRNYFPPLTEAYYRKLPILAVTSTQHTGRVGTYTPQVIDRSAQPKDTVKFSASIPTIHTKEDEWAYTLRINEALLELRHRGGGPAHLNMTTEYSTDFSVRFLPEVKVIKRFETSCKELPELKAKTVGIFVGAHTKWSDELTELVDSFCERYNAAVLCDHTSNYKGKYEIHPSLVPLTPRQGMDIMIHIGEVSGAYMRFSPKEVWRVSPDGCLRDPFRRLHYVFEMSEEEFFSHYVENTNWGGGKITEYYDAWRHDYDYVLGVLENMQELPFSNAWIAQHTINRLPENSILHLGILNSLRCWNFFELPHKSILSFCNTGGFGIDGCVSSFTGASFASPDKLFFGIIGDVAFFYDLNSIGNRHIGSNIRLMIVNNGCGAEMNLYGNVCVRSFGEGTHEFFTARGHFAKQSRDLVRHYASDLGFEYLSASNKEEYLANVERFTTSEKLDKPILFEVFTDPDDESNALYAINNMDIEDILPPSMRLKRTVKRNAKSILGEKNIRVIKKMMGR